MSDFRNKVTVRAIKKYLKINKDYAMLIGGDGSFINCYNPDTHRLHGKIDTIGAISNRCTHSKPNLTQFPKTKEFRELLTVPEGRALIDMDIDALELTVLGHYLGPYDDYEFAKAVDSGKKENGTDIHTLNQKRTGLPSRDAAKRMIFATVYGCGATKLGNMLWDGSDFEYTQAEYIQAKATLLKKAKTINGKLCLPFDKNQYEEMTENAILAAIYGQQVLAKLRDGLKGYKEFSEWAAKSIVNNHITALDGRKLFITEPHKVLNLYIQSAGAIYMKYLLCNIEKELSSKYKYTEDYMYVSNIHDALNIECRPEIAEDICETLKKQCKATSEQLGFKYPLKGNPAIGKSQWDTH